MKIKQLSIFFMALFSAQVVIAGNKPTLELIMSDTDWMGNAPENPYWSDDGKSIYFQKKQQGTELRDWFRLDAETQKLELLDIKGVINRDNNGGYYNQDRSLKLYVRGGDVYRKDMKSGQIKRITHTSATESEPQFITSSNDHEIAFWVGNKALKLTNDGNLVEVVDIQKEKKQQQDATKKPYDFLLAQQQRYFITLKEKTRNQALTKQLSDQRKQARHTKTSFYLDADLVIEEKTMSPDARYVLLIVSEKGFKKGQTGKLPSYVTNSGYVEIKKVRTRVGENGATPHFLVVLDLINHQQKQIKLENLPGINDDPLKKIRKKSMQWHMGKGATKEEAMLLVAAPDTRDVNVWDAHWSDDSKQLALLIKSLDNKDRWIATLNTETLQLTNQHRLHDNGWINWKFNQFGWLPDNKTIWLLSEEDGFSHLYTKKIKSKKAKQLSKGKWEVHDPVLSQNGQTLYFRSNKTHPGVYEIYQLDIASKKITQISHLGGSNSFSLSQDETRLIIQHATITSKPDIYVKEIASEKTAIQLTHSMSEEYRAIDWVTPTIEKVKSSHVKQTIFSKLYQPESLHKEQKYPAVIFVHGAGYTQNSHFGWAYYFHELMFHTLLVNQGYIVLDMDYRGSAGYGRDWRTAIYRNMGHPEVEDLQDGVNFLVENYQVDRNRVGVYGGSYGGFLTFMALFREPDLFAAGAALRPVTDWAHYNNQYTSNILNTPAVDPIAYEVSSPIEFAEGLTKPLLIASGMLDDNVFFQDSVRLVQRLIELKKENFEMAIFPMEKHGFKHHTSWLNEYRKIYKLFEDNLK